MTPCSNIPRGWAQWLPRIRKGYSASQTSQESPGRFDQGLSTFSLLTDCPSTSGTQGPPSQDGHGRDGH
eukprot:9880447-Heterocapsa_arctica.AAC.1